MCSYLLLDWDRPQTTTQKPGCYRAGLCLYHLSGSADIAETASPSLQPHDSISVTRQDTISKSAFLLMTVQILNTVKYKEAKIFIL